MGKTLIGANLGRGVTVRKPSLRHGENKERAGRVLAGVGWGGALLHDLQVRQWDAMNGSLENLNKGAFSCPVEGIPGPTKGRIWTAN